MSDFINTSVPATGVPARTTPAEQTAQPPSINESLNAREYARLHQGRLLRAMQMYADPPGSAPFEPNPVAAGIAKNIINDLLERPPKTARELLALRGRIDGVETT